VVDFKDFRMLVVPANVADQRVGGGSDGSVVAEPGAIVRRLDLGYAADALGLVLVVATAEEESALAANER
jgi:hypothetical protein